MKVIAKPVLRTYEVLLTEDDLDGFLRDRLHGGTLQVTHVDRAPNDDECMVRICIAGVSKA